VTFLANEVPDPAQFLKVAADPVPKALLVDAVLCLKYLS
jgi:hypothetical protein